MQVALNRCFGGFSLSRAAADYLGLEWDGYGYFNYTEDCSLCSDPKLIQCIKELGKKANGLCADIAIITIPDGINWYIDEYDSIECVRERGHCWPEEDDE